MTKRERLNQIARGMEDLLIEKYGTSEGAMAAWDTRGRGRKTPEKKEPKPKGTETGSWGRVLDGSGQKIDVDARVKDQYGNVYTVLAVRPSSVIVKEKPNASFHPSKLTVVHNLYNTDDREDPDYENRSDKPKNKLKYQ